MNTEKERQQSIVRQSQMERTIEMFGMLGVVPDNITSVLALHQILTDYILTGEFDKNRVKNFNTWLGNYKQTSKSKEEDVRNLETDVKLS